MDPGRATSSNSKNPAQLLRDWLITPPASIRGPDERRQAALLSAVLLGLMVSGAVVEIIFVLSTNSPDYVGYRGTIGALFVLGLIYALSRTRFFRLASVLAILAIVAAIFLMAWEDPSSVAGGVFDYLLLPLLLGSVYLSMGGLVAVALIELAGMVIFPALVPQVAISVVLVGPFSLILMLALLLVMLTWHRNLLEHDRSLALAEKEADSRREAARTGALLELAGRLNSQLDLETLLSVLAEELARALNVPISVVTLYDPRKDCLNAMAGAGISQGLVRRIPPLPRSAYDRAVAGLGRVFGVDDLHTTADLAFFQAFKQLDFRALAFAAMEYEGELIGSLAVVSPGTERRFTREEFLLLQGISDQAAPAIINIRLYKDARRRMENLQALRAIDAAIASNRELRETLDVLLAQITTQLAVDAAVILLMDQTKQTLEFGASRGFGSQAFRYTRLRLGEGMAGRAAQEREVIHIHDLHTDPQTLIHAPSLAKEGFSSYFAVPLITKDEIKGVLEIFHRSILEPDEEWLRFMDALAAQAAIAVEHTTLFDDLVRSNEELSKAYDSTIEGWSHALDLRDKETEGHTRRVTTLTLELARLFGFKDAELVHIRRGGLLHDIGKMGVPDRILLKEGPLSAEEWEIMRRHPVYAYELLLPIEYLRPALDIPYCHHEKWDGSGYPRGLKGEEIPLTARIFAVVDVWDALTSDRPYRGAWPAEKALTHIREGAGLYFDPSVVQAFMEFIGQERAGSLSAPSRLDSTTTV